MPMVSKYDKEEEALRQAPLSLPASSSSTRRKRSASTRKKRAAQLNDPFLPSVNRLTQMELLQDSEAARPGMPKRQRLLHGLPVYILFHCAFGYALFVCHDLDEVEYNFEATEEYIKRYKQVFKPIGFYHFQSTDAALHQLTNFNKSNPTKELIDFVTYNLPEEMSFPGGSKFPISCGDIFITQKIARRLKISATCGLRLSNFVRGLRSNICEFFGKKPAELEKCQRDLALSFARQRCKSTYKGNSMVANSSSYFFDDEVVVVEPHKFEGIFIVKGKNNDAMCTKNLVPGEAVNEEELISVKNKDGIETEYRIWDPSKSKLAAAIQCGVENIWVKPGSRVLYIGDVCETKVSHLSDLVGPDGLVYVVSSSDAVVNMAEKRSNVIPIYDDYSAAEMYLMLVSMVDVICADLEDPLKVRGPTINVGGLATNALYYLRAGGHFLVFTQADSIVQTSENGVAIETLTREEKREFNILEMIKLEQDHKGLVMIAGCYRKLDA
ncbi:rRNA 2'-O-methyltransferase fibrillarin 2 [Linum perenne]